MLKRRVAPKVDFVIWTGDSSRHDRDDFMKREETEVMNQNMDVYHYITSAFDPDSIPILPSIGNWDTYPQNLMGPGPNPMLKQLWKLWSRLFPSRYTSEGKEIYSTFKKGGYYAREVIPDQLTIISVNNLYWFKENTMVNDCGEHSDHHDDNASPGHVELHWMSEVLSNLRFRNMKAIIIGHVPPRSVENEVLYKSMCYERFVHVIGEFADVIIGQFYGHTNKDVISLVLKEGASIPNDNAKVTPIRYELISLNAMTIPNIDLDNKDIVGVVQQSPSIVPVYNPGYKLITVASSNYAMDNASSVYLSEQTQYYLDVERANEEHDFNPTAELGDFSPKGCSSRTDFNLLDFTPESLTNWITQVQRQGMRFKKNPIRNYFMCMEIHTSDLDSQTRINNRVVAGILVAGAFMFIVGMVVLFVFNRQLIHEHPSEAELERLLI